MQFIDIEYGAADIILMLDVLHKQGYEGLRILPGMSPNGCCWRWMIYPRKKLKGDLYKVEQHGDFMPDCPCGSIGYAEHKADYHQMAEVFLQANPELCQEAHHHSPNYIKWFERLVEKAKLDIVPIAFADWWDAPEWEFTDGEPLHFPPYYVKKKINQP